MKNRLSRSAMPINTLGWMMTYADMATLLLALFIVLSTLGKDQTGVGLCKAARSFGTALDSFGLPRVFSVSDRKPRANFTAPQYLDEGREDKEDRDDESERESLWPFLQELSRQFPVQRERSRIGQVVIDLYEPLRREAPLLKPGHVEAFERVRPLLDRTDVRLHLVVWPTTPRPSAWNRAASQARQVADELGAQLTPDAAARLTPLAQPWRYPDVRRPALSLLVVKVAE